MLDQLQRQGLALSWKTGNDKMEGNGSDLHQDKARRFRDAALPYLDDVYTLARYLLRNTGDAEDAVQECYLRALRHGEFARRSGGLHYIDQYVDGEADKDEDAVRPLWQEPQLSPETEVLHQRDAQTIRRLVAELPDQFREAIVLREINDLSYREIADVVGVPVGTVMSRLARARSMLRKAWILEEEPST